MLTFTDRAEEMVAAYLERSEDGVPRAMRIGPTQDGVEVPYDLTLVDARHPASSDVVLDDVAPFPVHVDALCREELRGATVEFLDDEDATGFQVVTAEDPSDEHLEEGPSLDEIEARVREVIAETVNPTIEAHGGEMELVEVQDGVAHVEMAGGCQGCAASSLTLQAMVRQMISAEVPQVQEIEDVTDHSEGDDPYYPTQEEIRETPAEGG